MTPGTLLAWYRNVIARKWIYDRTGPGRPCVSGEISELVLRFVRSIKTEYLERMILFDERAFREYSTHYLSEHNHQGVDNQLLKAV